MAKKTITYPVCDACGKVLSAPSDGLVIRGQVFAAGAQLDDATPLLGPRHAVHADGAETAACWECWHRIVSDKVLERERERVARVEQASYQRDIDYSRPGGGPSGPLPPPEIPHHVATTQPLCGVRGRR